MRASGLGMRPMGSVGIATAEALCAARAARPRPSDRNPIPEKGSKHSGFPAKSYAYAVGFCRVNLSRSAVWGRMVTQRSLSAKSAASTDQPIVFVVDDDASMRQALARLFQSVELRAEVFASPQEFLQGERPNAPSCLVLDVRLPGLSGLDFQAELAKADVRIPIVFITGHGDIPMTVRAMKAGAVDFLAKPFRDQDLLDAVTAAIQRDQRRREHENTLADLKAHFSSLTTREREIMALVASGLMSKQIAAQIGLSEITVKVHRSHVMKKMGARSVADLVRMAEALGVKPEH